MDLSLVSSCSFYDEENPCHKTSFKNEIGQKLVTMLNPTDIALLMWRSGNQASHVNTNNMTICHYHHTWYLERFSKNVSQLCIDPLKMHNKKKSAQGRRIVTLEFAQELKEKGIDVVPGYKLCSRCVTNCKAANSAGLGAQMEICNESDSCTTSSSASDFEKEKETEDLINTSKQNEAQQTLNASLNLVGESPLSLHSIPKRQKPNVCKRKLVKAKQSLASRMCEVADISIQDVTPMQADDITTKERKELEQLRSNSTELMTQLKRKFDSSFTSYREKLQILTLTPSSWSIAETSQFFNCTQNQVRTAKKLKEEFGILATPIRKTRHGISDDVKQLVLDVYEDDEYSRLMPGVKDKVSLGNKVHHQKRLMLCTIKELYSIFKENHPSIKIGLTKFQLLKPKWCVSPGSAGTHNVCVCSIHQNAVLLADGCGLSYKDMMAMIVCSTESRNCMLHHCDICPDDSSLRNAIKNAIGYDEGDEDEITVSQWVSTDRTEIRRVCFTPDQFVDECVKQIQILTKHSFTAKSQGKYLKQCKENNDYDKALVLLDFAENYQFIIQNEVQSYHWCKNYCTIHPIVVYMKNEDGQSTTVSICIISDDLTHDTSFIYCLQKSLTEFLKIYFPQITKLQYFSDGCSGQYKNFKNFLNLCHHSKDFGFSASWSFFATSHGKSPCDGVGGTVKRKLSNASLTAAVENSILTSEAAYDYCMQHITGITFFHLSSSDIEACRLQLQDRYSKGSTVPGTRGYHHFCPVTSSKIGLKFLSSDCDFTGVHSFYEDSHAAYSWSELQLNRYVACKYDCSWWVGQIIKLDERNEDVQLRFMHPKGPAQSFFWPTHDDICWIPREHLLLKIHVPATRNGRMYQIRPEETKKLNSLDLAKSC